MWRTERRTVVQSVLGTGDHVATTERLDAAVLVDRAADGRAIGIEIVDPSQFGPDRLMDVLRALGLGEVDRDEFKPLAAA